MPSFDRNESLLVHPRPYSFRVSQRKKNMKKNEFKLCLRSEKFDMMESSFSSRKKRWEILMFVSLAAGILWTVASRVPSAIGAPLASAPSPREGFLAPDFKLNTMDGNQVTLSELR